MLNIFKSKKKLLEEIKRVRQMLALKETQADQYASWYIEKRDECARLQKELAEARKTYTVHIVDDLFRLFRRNVL